MSKQSSTEILNKYLRWIDEAIARRKYMLAYRIAHRCLNNHYSDFIHTNIPGEKALDNLSTKSISISRYLMSQGKSGADAERISRIPMVTSSMFGFDNRLFNHSKKYVDRAYALFARNNVSAIVNMLNKHMDKK